jgi:putative glycosyltransferase
MDLSIVTTLYKSEPYLMEFYSRIKAQAQAMTADHEIIFVDDGSPDGSLDVALALSKQDPKVTVIELSRNFGHHKAMMTGLEHSVGELVFLIDCDLEEPPELLGRFAAEMDRQPVDVVYGVQLRRKGGAWERVSGKVFFTLFNLLSHYPIPANLITARLMKRPYVSALVRHRDKEVFMAGLWAITGFRQLGVPVEKGHRGATSYRFSRRMAILVNAITAFSNRPLVMIFHLGVLISAGAMLAALYIVIRRVFFNQFLSGWPSLIVSVWFLGGVIILCLGVIGIYLSKVFSETKDRPYTIIRNVHRRGTSIDQL